MALDFVLAGEDAADKNCIVAAVEAFGVGVCGLAAGDCGIAVPVKVQNDADVSLLINRPDNVAAAVDHSHRDAQHLRLVLKGILVRVAGQGLHVHFHRGSIERHDLYDVGHADARGGGLLLALCKCVLCVLVCQGFTSLERLHLYRRFPVSARGADVLPLDHDILPVQVAALHLYLFRRADVVVEQHFAGDILALLALG